MPPGGGFHPFGGRVSRHFGDTLAPEDPYLSYYDCRLTREDVDTLRNDWLTDNMIAFWQDANAREKVSMSMGGKVVDAAGGRKEMLRIIEGYRKEGERRRSHDESRSSSPFRRLIEDSSGVTDHIRTALGHGTNE
ncbi:hypothetical protein DID88_004119 [Monilinia fructigena]|uniref:Uncharacterized protein n=1 Tax=Monilinia fructigena TaxID=38457 RepID=A0A395IT45_9HELO|nr:hypothetical protein DID88_004119 [Monilinia fructigena]